MPGTSTAQLNAIMEGEESTFYNEKRAATVGFVDSSIVRKSNQTPLSPQTPLFSKSAPLTTNRHCLPSLFLSHRSILLLQLL